MNTANRQTGNVGNLGDILKHAALLSLAGLFRQEDPLCYVETHAFRSDAPPPDTVRWRGVLAGLLADWPAYDAYAAVEAIWLARGRYRCSVGLAADALPQAHLLLAEAHQPTREALAMALAEAGRKPIGLAGDFHHLPAGAAGADPGAVLALVDPFDCVDDAWPVVADLLTRLHRPGSPAVVQAFSYRRDGEVRWPNGPAGLAGPVATISRPPYHLATYCDAQTTPLVVQILVPLGWQAAGG